MKTKLSIFLKFDSSIRTYTESIYVIVQSKWTKHIFHRHNTKLNRTNI